MSRADVAVLGRRQKQQQQHDQQHPPGQLRAATHLLSNSSGMSHTASHADGSAPAAATAASRDALTSGCTSASSDLRHACLSGAAAMAADSSGRSIESVAAS